MSVAIASSLDLRALLPAEAGPALLAAFDNLAPGEVLTLVLEPGSASEPLSVLQRERRGLFEWTPSAGSAEITRRPGAAGQLRGVTEALSWDHDRLDALEASAFQAFASGNAYGARERFARFAEGLERHIGFEEEVLFPVFEARTGLPRFAGPTAVMRHEHVTIKALLRAIEASLAGDGADAPRLRAELHQALGLHNQKEERILYPGTDQMLAPQEADELVARIQAY